MAVLTVYQKYPLPNEDQSGAKSMRLNHPDYANVVRCPYAEGVISDIKKTGNNPITVQSQVKVTIDGTESDWLPLYYHPKAKYWDGAGTPPSPMATDYNQADKYFERAWMSFRIGDEVAVILQASLENEKPTAVAAVAFADGVPRIGEDLIQFKDGPIIQCSLAQIYSDTVGPDGLDLKLLRECRVVGPVALPTWEDWVWYSDAGIMTYCGANPQESLFDMFFYFLQSIMYGRRYDLLVPVGPILYRFSMTQGKRTQFWWGGA